MVPDWNYVKKTTLWQYEELIRKLKFVTAYPAIWQACNQEMAQAADFARRLFPERDIAGCEFPAGVPGTLAHENPQEMACCEALKAQRLMHSFDPLEEGRNPQGRRSLPQRTGRLFP